MKFNLKKESEINKRKYDDITRESIQRSKERKELIKKRTEEIKASRNIKLMIRDGFNKRNGK